MAEKNMNIIPHDMEIWGGLECTINRIGDEYRDQLQLAGHYERESDLNNFSKLGIKALRYPILWEKYQPERNTLLDFAGLSEDLINLKKLKVEPIAGLLHHGSGPAFTNLIDENFPELFAEYARVVASHFPFIEYFTPVNEPLTTARFSGLYGHWYPHHRSELSFFKMLLNQLKGVVQAMKEIRKINSEAKLIQTEDLGKVFSTPYLNYQADFENIRRWLTFDILTGGLNPKHPLWNYILNAGISLKNLYFFLDNPCPPDIIGVNYYITSERYLDENMDKYPKEKCGRNNTTMYSDIEAARVELNERRGLKWRLHEIWFKYKLPLAVTEIHLNCHREEQMRWFFDAWKECLELREKGVNIKAITAWSLLGAFGWDKLLIGPELKYETGVYDISSGKLRETSLAHMIRNLSTYKNYNHPVLKSPGWWKRNIRFQDKDYKFSEILDPSELIFIISRRGSLGKVFAKQCEERAINYLSLGKKDFDLTNPVQMRSMVGLYKPWAIINCAGYVNIDMAESNIKTCLEVNTKGVINLAEICRKSNVKLVTFSSDMIFNGKKNSSYSEEDEADPINIYGLSKLLAEKFVQSQCPNSLIIRTSSFFSPYDNYNFLHIALNEVSNGKKFTTANDVIISPTYLPHLANKSLDLMIDDEKGIVHLTNNGSLTWFQFAEITAKKFGQNTEYIIGKNINCMNLKAKRPVNSALVSIRGRFLPSLEEGINDFIYQFKQKRSQDCENILIQ